MVHARESRGTGVIDSTLRLCNSVGFRDLASVELAVALAAGASLAASVLDRRVRATSFSVCGSAADAAIVGTSLALGRHTRNPVDPDRVDRLEDAVRTLRQGRRRTSETGLASKLPDAPQARPH